jgi:hypothetical protein
MPDKHLDSLVSDLPKLVPAKQAAEFLHAHVQTVRELRRQGELVGVQRRAKRGSPLLIVRDSLRDYCERNQR